MYRIISLILLLTCLSCSTLTFENNHLESQPKYFGKIKEIKKSYSWGANDPQIVVMRFDQNNNMIELEEDFEYKKCIAKYYYDSNLFIRTYYKCTDSTSVEIIIRYDEKGRQIQHIRKEDGQLYKTTCFKYDRNNNITRIESQYPGSSPEIKDYFYNYKVREATVNITKDSLDDTYYKLKYSRKGKIILSEVWSRKVGLWIRDEYIYNNENFKKIILDSPPQKVSSISTYKYHRDRKGNIIKIEHYSNGDLYELTTYDITYR